MIKVELIFVQNKVLKCGCLRQCWMSVMEDNNEHVGLLLWLSICIWRRRRKLRRKEQ